MPDKTTVILEIHNPPRGRRANHLAWELGAYLKDYLESRGCDGFDYDWEEPATGSDDDARIRLTLFHGKGEKSG